jgi:hypothetical protein
LIARSAALVALLAIGCQSWDDFATRDPTLAPPRPIAPPGGVRLTGTRPLFRWELAPGTDGAIVELCADRACEEVLLRFAADGASSAAPVDLAPGVLFWRLRARRAGAIGERTSPVWSAVAPSIAQSRASSAWYGSTLDLDGDGLSDLAIPAPGLGRVFFHRGRGDRLPVETLAISLPSTTTDPLGLRVASAGDVDGDGFVDLLIAARSDCPTPYAHEGPPGIVYVLRGGPSGPEAAPSRTLTIATPAACFGHAAVGADLDRDGYSDVIVALRDATRVLVYPGSATGTLETPLERIIPGAAEVGRSLGTGDLDGDGFGDVVIEAFGPGAGDLEIAAFVLRGGPLGPAVDLERLPTPAIFTTTQRNGAGVIGDVDADGLPDVALADETTIAVLASSLDPAAPLLLPSAGGRDAIRALGDIDADGYDDFAVGSGAGRVGIWLGGDPSAALEAIELRWEGGAGVDHAFGASVAGPGDVDGDGRADVVIGAREVTGPAGSIWSGRAYLFFGADDRSLDEPFVMIGPDRAEGQYGTGLAY